MRVVGWAFRWQMVMNDELGKMKVCVKTVAEHFVLLSVKTKSKAISYWAHSTGWKGWAKPECQCAPAVTLCVTRDWGGLPLACWLRCLHLTLGYLGVTSGSVLDPSFLLMRTEREQQRWLTWERPGLCSSSWPHLGPTLDVACIWGMNQWLEDLFLSFSLTFFSLLPLVK